MINQYHAYQNTKLKFLCHLTDYRLAWYCFPFYPFNWRARSLNYMNTFFLRIFHSRISATLEHSHSFIIKIRFCSTECFLLLLSAYLISIASQSRTLAKVCGCSSLVLALNVSFVKKLLQLPFRHRLLNKRGIKLCVLFM